MSADGAADGVAGDGPRSATRRFSKLVAQLEYSMFVLTAAEAEERVGCLIGFASQVSIHPPRFLACVSVKNKTYGAVCAIDTVVVHVVPRDALQIAELFGGQTGDEVDKFARCDWQPGPGGAPVLSELRNWFAGRVLERLHFGDHLGLLLEPVEVSYADSEAPLTFHRAKWIEPGHEP